MTNLGKVIITPNSDNLFNVNLYVTPSEIIYSLERAESFCPARVTVQYEGVFAGTAEQQKEYIFNCVESFLYENGYLDKTPPRVRFKDCDYKPSQKLLGAIK